MLLSLHATADRTDPRGWRVRAHRHVSRPVCDVQPQHLHADERHHRGPPGPRRSIDRRSGSRVGVSRCFGPIARSYRSADLDSASLGGAPLWPGCVHVPDHALVRTLRSSSQIERGQQRLTGVGACCDGGDSKDRRGDHRGPHDINEDVDGTAELEPVHGLLRVALGLTVLALRATTNVNLHNLDGAASIRLSDANLDRHDMHLTPIGSVGRGTHGADDTRRTA